MIAGFQLMMIPTAARLHPRAGLSYPFPGLPNPAVGTSNTTK